MIIFEYMGRQVASNMGGRRGTTFKHLGGQVLSDRGGGVGTLHSNIWAVRFRATGSGQ